MIGAGGIVGGAISREARGIENRHALGVARKDVDLLSPNGAAALQALLRRDDAVVLVSEQYVLFLSVYFDSSYCW